MSRSVVTYIGTLVPVPGRPSQCQVVNDLYENEQNRRLEGGGIAIRESPLRPDPQMNDSYFMEE